MPLAPSNIGLSRFSAAPALLLVFRITIRDRDSSNIMNSNYKIDLLIDLFEIDIREKNVVYIKSPEK